MAFMAFGVGPRNCIGMKFALMELKIGMNKIIQELLTRRSHIIY